MNRINEFEKYSALDHSIGRRLTYSFGGWLRLCEGHDAWHELPPERQEPTIENVATFLDDYRDFQKEE